MKEKITDKLAIEVEQQEDGTWVGYAYRKVGKSWSLSGATSRYETQEKARKGAIALSK